MKNVFDVIQFGAVGDGVTDCTKALTVLRGDCSTCAIDGNIGSLKV
jgi:polygalacturonase